MAESSVAEVEYRDIPRWPGYRVSSGGWVESSMCGEWRRLRENEGCRGYLGLYLYRPGERKRFSIHRLVCEIFHGHCPVGMVCCHGDGNQKNNSASNLRWDTQKANIADTFLHGTKMRGSKQGSARLNDELIPRIRAMFLGGLSQVKIARQLGVGRSTIGRVVRGENWAHVA